MNTTGTKNYNGIDWFWPHDFRHYLRDANAKQRKLVHNGWLKIGVPVKKTGQKISDLYLEPKKNQLKKAWDIVRKVVAPKEVGMPIPESVDEGKFSNIMKAVRKGPKAGPWNIIISKNNKIKKQVSVKNLKEIPAYYEDLKKAYPNHKIGIEAKDGKIVYREDVNEGSCGYGIDGQLGNEPAGPHLLKKKKKKKDEASLGSMMSKKIGKHGGTRNKAEVEKIIKYLMKKGDTKKTALDKIEQNYDYVSKKYRTAPISKKAQILTSLQESVNEAVNPKDVESFVKKKGLKGMDLPFWKVGIDYPFYPTKFHHIRGATAKDAEKELSTMYNRASGGKIGKAKFDDDRFLKVHKNLKENEKLKLKSKSGMGTISHVGMPPASKGVEKLFKIADTGFGKVGGQTVDSMSANLFRQIYDKASDDIKMKLNKKNEKQLIRIIAGMWNKFGKNVKLGSSL